MGPAFAAPEPTPTPTASPERASPPIPPALHGIAPGRPTVTVVGIPGLRWNDVSEDATPALWKLAGESALAAMSVRTALPTACPLDGWLTLSSGARSIAPREDGRCLPVAKARDGSLIDGTSRDALVEENQRYSYGPEFGTLAGIEIPLGEINVDPPDERTGACAVGPGAALALSDLGAAAALVAEKVGDLGNERCNLLVVDAGALPLEGRDDALAAADETVAEAVEATGDGAVLVAGIGDSDPDAAHLSAVLLRDGGDAEPGWLYAPSTRRTRLVQITDLTATVLDRLGRTPPEGVGSVLETRPRNADTAAAVRDLDRLDLAAETVRTNFVIFFVVLIAGQVLTYAAIGAAYLRGRLDRARAGRAIRAVGLAFGSAPAATFLVNLGPWEATGRPAAALWAGLVAISALLATLVLAGPWRHRPFGPVGAVAALTGVVLAVDVATGSHLQLNALYGLSPLVAGRFYGFGNVAFAVFAMAALLTAAWAGTELARRGDARRAAGAVLGIGAFAVAVDGWPSFGADFGGVLALLPGVAVLAFGVAGWRLTVARAALVTALTVAVVAAIAVADWTRPDARRSHLGRFVQDVLDGEAVEVVRRKADANLGLLVDAPVIVALGLPLIVLVVLALARPSALRVTGLAEAQEREPVLRVVLVACVTTALIGFAVNDSGIIVPAVALTAAGPLATALWAGVWASGPARPHAHR